MRMPDALVEVLPGAPGGAGVTVLARAGFITFHDASAFLGCGELCSCGIVWGVVGACFLSYLVGHAVPFCTPLQQGCRGCNLRSHSSVSGGAILVFSWRFGAACEVEPTRFNECVGHRRRPDRIDWCLPCTTQDDTPPTCRRDRFPKLKCSAARHAQVPKGECGVGKISRKSRKGRRGKDLVESCPKVCRSVLE